MRFRPIAGLRKRSSEGDGAEPEVVTEPEVSEGDVQLRIGGMTCAGCATTIRDGLLQLPGVASAGVSPVTRRAVLRPDGTMPAEDLEMLAGAAITGLGYHVVERDAPAT
ncbi:heavy-metal-associated domain-containing protein [Demequina zhanjiangensis]|uniref:Heavy metal-associated domain-containing protein n=1 Tax=Demequina zhanjiangensis TaxID=3051659 RepID=A0ABT8FZH8_9MICO|nr:heavy metal-associated domain-containing protein [Demequina sp. SYSU T00b26]MDN4472227.1 heavy metal-associated domain-containing protein [Demequina sp. SYSU T00b26]